MSMLVWYVGNISREGEEEAGHIDMLLVIITVCG
jgi:hypothetical protein